MSIVNMNRDEIAAQRAEVSRRFSHAVMHVQKNKDIDTFAVAVADAARDYGIDYRKLLAYFEEN